MTVLNARSRMISIRLSEDEYSAVVKLCASSGARSVSDLARVALRLLVRGGEAGFTAQPHTEGLVAQIHSLNQKIEELNDRVTRATREA